MEKVLLKDIVIKNNDLIKGTEFEELKNKIHKSDLKIYFRINNDDKIYYSVFLLDSTNKIALRKNYPLTMESDIENMIILYNYYHDSKNITIEELLNNGYEYAKINDAK